MNNKELKTLFEASLNAEINPIKVMVKQNLEEAKKTNGRVTKLETFKNIVYGMFLVISFILGYVITYFITKSL